jgi:hypothetical protein
MGGFYGSIHVRTNDRDSVVAAVCSLKIDSVRRFYVAPPINGWVSVFPEGNGQDSAVSEGIAAVLNRATIVHCAVHDDDVFAYWLYANGTISDAYNSCPTYFGEEDAPPRGGNARSFLSLVSNPNDVDTLQALLDADNYTFELERQDRFAGLLGLPHTDSAYEYLVNGETSHIKEWKQFIHIPDLADEKKKGRAAAAALRAEVKQLLAAKVLFVDAKAEKNKNGYGFQHFTWCSNPAKPEVIVAVKDGIHSLEPAVWKRYALPNWQPETVGFSFSSSPFGFQVSPSGRLIAVPQHSRLQIWDLETQALVTDRELPGIVNLVAFGDRDADVFVVIRNPPTSTLLHIPLRDGAGGSLSDNVLHFQSITPHPNGKFLAVIDNFGILLVVEILSMRVVAQVWIKDRSSLLNINAVREAAEQMVNDVTHLVPGSDAAGYRDASARHFLPSDAIRICRFNEDGAWLFCGARCGMHLLKWEDVLHSKQLAPIDPQVSVEAERSSRQTDEDPIERRLVYGIVFDSVQQRVLFSGLEGKISFYDLLTRRSGTLLNVPGGAALIELALTSDRSGLVATARNFDFKNRKEKPFHFQIWNYRALCQHAPLPH